MVSLLDPLETLDKRRLERLRETQLKALGNALAQAVQAGMELATRPDKRRAVKLDALKCMVAPHLVFDGNVPEPETAVVARAEPSSLPELSEVTASPS